MIQTPSRNNSILSLIDKGYYWSIAIFCIVLPVKPSFLHNLQAYALGFFLIMALMKIFVNKSFSIKGKAKDLIIFCSLFIWLALSLLYSEDLGQGLKYLETKLGLILLPLFLIIVNPISKAQFQNVLKLFMIAVCAMMLIAFATVIVHNYNYNQFDHIVWVFYFYHSLVHFIGMHAVYMSIQVSLALLISVHFCFQKVNSNRNYLGYGIAILFLSISLIFLTVKMIIVAFGLAIFVYTLSRFGKKKAVYISALFLMIIASALLIFSSNNRFSNRISFVPKNVNLDYEKSPENTDGYWGSINLRIALAKNALEIIKSNPVLGTGIGDEKSERLKQYNLNHFYFGINQEFNEHNQYLNILLSSGAIGLLILLNLLGYPFLKSFQNSDFLYLAFITLIVFSFLSENYLSRLQGVSFFAFFHTLFWIQNQQTNKTIQSN